MSEVHIHSSGSSSKRRKGLHPKSSAYKDLKKSKKVFKISLLVAVLLFLIDFFKIYKNEVGSVIYKILYFPLLAILFVIPVFSMISLMKKKFNPRSYYLYALILSIFTLIFVAFK